MRLAIIGAGVAGLAAARALRTHAPSITTTIYEKSRGFGGRVATRRREGYVFDHGAQVIKGPSPAVERLLTHELDASLLRRLDLPTWTFDGAGTIAEGDARLNAEPSFFYADGNNRLGKLLAEGLDVRRETRVASLHRSESGTWEIVDTQGTLVGRAEAVLFTAPAPQTVDILQASGITDPDLLAELGQASYRPCLSLALAYERILARPFYALVNLDRQHPLVWLGLEHSKGGERCPPGHSLLIAQMAPQWSHDHYDDAPEALTPIISTLVGELLGEDLDTPLWADLQRWRYALPNTSSHFERVNDLGAPHGLFFAGDFTCEKGRVHLAIERGWHVARRLASTLS